MATRVLSARTLLAAALASAALACIQDDGTRFDPIPGRQRMSADSEREVGWEFDQKAQQVLPIITDLAVLEFMSDLGNVLVEGLGEQPFDYRFRVVANQELHNSPILAYNKHSQNKSHNVPASKVVSTPPSE